MRTLLRAGLPSCAAVAEPSGPTTPIAAHFYDTMTRGFSGRLWLALLLASLGAASAADVLVLKRWAQQHSVLLPMTAWSTMGPALGLSFTHLNPACHVPLFPLSQRLDSQRVCDRRLRARLPVSPPPDSHGGRSGSAPAAAAAYCSLFATAKLGQQWGSEGAAHCPVLTHGMAAVGRLAAARWPACSTGSGAARSGWSCKLPPH